MNRLVPSPAGSRRSRAAWLSLLAALLLASVLGSVASAGIIVTEGRLTDEEGESLSATNPDYADCDRRCEATLEQRGAARVTGPPPTTIVDGDDDEDEGDDTFADDDDQDEDEDEDSELGDLDDTPKGWTCTSVAGGIELCEKDDESEASDDDTGASPGAGSGQSGSLSADELDDASWSDETDTHAPMAGCSASGSGSSPAAPLVWLLALATLVLLRRRAF